MRVTDHRYVGEIDKFDLAIRLIRHEARTGTIRACTGFSEDRIRKIYTTYFKTRDARDVKRRRGKSPKRVAQFVNSTPRQLEATVLAGLFLLCGAGRLGGGGKLERSTETDRVELGQRLCQAFETYQGVHPEPRWSFEWAWNLYHSLVERRELYFANCDSCSGPYVQDAYALDYHRCPFCEMTDQRQARGA